MATETLAHEIRAKEAWRFADLRTVALELPTLTDEQREQARNRILRDLRERIEPQTSDESQLFPDVTARLGDPLVAVCMNYDQLAIQRWLSRIAVADVRDTARLQRLLYGLDALIRVHTWKQSELYLALPK